jgi:hypothetical protein
MTPKKKAEELFNNFYQATEDHWNQVPVSKQCALIAVDEILLATGLETKGRFEFYLEVKKEIELL